MSDLPVAHPAPPSMDEDPEVRKLRTLPQAVDAERSVLGCVLIDNDALGAAMDVMAVEDMYKEQHRLVMEAMVALENRADPIDELTVANELKKQGSLERVGGVAALSEMAASTPTSAHVRAYARIVHDRAIARRMIQAATSIVEDGLKGEGDIREYVDNAERIIFEVSDDKKRRGYQPIRDVLLNAYERLEAAANRGEAITGVPTGYDKLDLMTAGLQGSDLIIVAGRPSMGKTAITLNVAANAALRAKVCTLVFSLEMSAEQLANRMLGAEARVNLGNLRTGRIAPQDWQALGLAAGKISEAPLYIDDSGVVTVFDVRTKCRRLKREHNLGLVIIDYLQLMAGGGNSDNRAQEISEISRGLKAIARELNIPVVALSQLNRSLESRTDKRPMMSDLRESGAIEQDADVIAFLYRDDYYNKESPDKGKAEIIIAKQRNGPTGTVNLAFLPHLTRFENLADDA